MCRHGCLKQPSWDKRCSVRLLEMVDLTENRLSMPSALQSEKPLAVCRAAGGRRLRANFRPNRVLQCRRMDSNLIETISRYVLLLTAIFGALTAGFWLSVIIWTFRDMRLRSRDIFAQLLASLLVAILPIVGILLYLILRPPETLAERYERALEEEALLQNIEERPHCFRCDRVVEEKWQICAYCHTTLKAPCVECGELLELNWTRCPVCTTAQPSELASIPPHKAAAVAAPSPSTAENGAPPASTAEPTLAVRPLAAEIVDPSRVASQQ